MNKKITLTIIANLLLINNLYAYNAGNDCEVQLKQNNIQEAKVAAQKLGATDEFSSTFCLAKIAYQEDKAKEAIAGFSEAEKKATHPSEQMLAIMFKGLAHKENGQLDESLNIFTNGYETAKLGNSKFVQFERRFLHQMGDVQEQQKKYDDAYESFAKALKLASNDEERGQSYDRLARGAANLKHYDRAREYSLKGAVMYQKSGYLGEFAELTLLKAEYEVMDDDYDAGIQTLNDLEQLCIDAGGDYYLAKTYLQLSKLSKENKEGYLAKAKTIAKKIGADDLVKGI